MIMYRNQNRDRVGRRRPARAAAARPLVAVGTAGILTAAMLTTAVLAGPAPAGAAAAPHKAAAVSLPPIRSADGKIAPSSASGAAAWHAARARSGRGHSLSHALHVFLPRTHKLVAPSGSPRGVPQRTAPGAGTNRIAGIAPPRSLNVRPPAGSRITDITIGTNFNGSGYTGWIPPDGGLATGPHQVIVA